MAQIINGVWQAEPVTTRDQARHVTPVAEFDHLVAQLALIVTEASRLSHVDQKRLTDFVLAAGSMLLARTRLPPGDQNVFEAHLREAVSRQHGRY